MDTPARFLALTLSRRMHCSIILSSAAIPIMAWLYPGFNATLSNQPYFVVGSRQPMRS